MSYPIKCPSPNHSNPEELAILTRAVTELMSSPSSPHSKRKRSQPGHPRSSINPHRDRTVPDPHTGISLNNLHGRDALGAYILKPESFPSPQRVLRFDEEWVTIHDLYPKSSIHLLLLPRNAKLARQHPFKVLADPEFLAAARKQTQDLAKITATELRRLYGKYSKAETARNDALLAPDPPEELPPGRDWEAEVMVGVHANPSMNDMHIHIMSRDRHSDRLKHRRHYNSFSSDFFVPLDDFPLAEDDRRRHPGHEGYLERDMKCWQCGKNFRNQFKLLKAHLEEEFEEWKRV